MGLLKLTIDYLVWQRSLFRKVRRLALGYLLLTIIFFNISQVSALLAFFLPLKVIIMVASEGIPRYLRHIVTPENRNLSIVLFSMLAVGFYFLHLMCDYLSDVASEKAATKILARADKLALFYNENQLAKDFFLKLSCNIGTVLMVVCGFALGVYLNSLLFGALIAVVIVEYIGFGIFWNRLLYPGCLEPRLRFVKTLPNKLKFFSSFNFFVGFCLLIYVFFKDPNFGLLSGLLSFILFRQLMTRIQAALQDVFFLHKNRSKIDALFYTHIHYEPQVSYTENSFMDIIAPGNREAWLMELTQHYDMVTKGNWTWFDVPGKNIAVFWAMDEASEKMIFVKIFGKDQILQFKHEKLILDAFSKNTFLMPSLLSEYTHLGFRMLVCHDLFSFPIKQKGNSLKNTLNEAMAAMWQLQPDSRLVGQCSRTKPLLAARLSKAKLRQLFIAAVTVSEQEEIQRLIDAHEQLNDMLRKMPLFVFNPLCNALNLVVRGDGKPMLFSWTKWSLEPIGVGLPPKIKLNVLENMLQKASEKRPDLEGVTTAMVLMTGYVSQVEIAIANQNYRYGIRMAPVLLEYLQKCNDERGHHATLNRIENESTECFTKQPLGELPKHGL